MTQFGHDIGDNFRRLCFPPGALVAFRLFAARDFLLLLGLKPPQGLATAKIFSDPLLSRSTDAAILAGFAAVPYDFGRNDLQPVAQRLCPGIEPALQWLDSQGWQGRMTGSGSAVFARLPEGEVPSGVPPAGQFNVCSNLAVHPLLDWAASDRTPVGG